MENSNVWRTQMYGDATCGIIGLSNEWAVIGGKNLIIWVNEKLEMVNDPEIEWIFDLRLSGDYEIELLIDPWSENSAIWKFNIETFSKFKIRDFNDYKDIPYTEEVTW
jgi:hypothetical protein